MDELQALVILVEEEWVKEPLWGLPTSSAASWQQEDAPVQHLTPQAGPSQKCSAYIVCSLGHRRSIAALPMTLVYRCHNVEG